MNDRPWTEYTPPEDGVWLNAQAETNRLQRALDITNADHVALWIEHNTIPDEPMNQCASWLACRIVEAHKAAEAARIAELEAEVARLKSRLEWSGEHIDQLIDQMIDKIDAERKAHDEFRQQVQKVAEEIKDYTKYMQGLFAEAIQKCATSLLPAEPPKVDPLDEDPIDVLVELLAPVLTHGQGMAARERENRFRNALGKVIKVEDAP